MFQGYCHHDQKPPRPLAQTVTSQKFPSSEQPANYPPPLYQTNDYLILQNCDMCKVGQHVIVRSQAIAHETFVARVVEIIQKIGSQCFEAQQPDGVLIEVWDSSQACPKYQMPHLIPKYEWLLVPLEVRSPYQCTLDSSFKL